MEGEMATERTHQLQRVYVWEAPIRMAHWAHAFAIGALAVSGYYIGSPFIVVPSNASFPYVMASMRFTHAVAAIVLGLAFVVRIYWAIVGNRYAKVGALLPLTGRRWKDLFRQAGYYLFVVGKRPDYVGHNPLAGLSYFAIYVLVFLQGVTGLALYSEYYPGGFWDRLFGWLTYDVASNNVLRLVHHSLMWVFVVFFLAHLYLDVIDEFSEQRGTTSSMLTGYKAVEEETKE
jgi:Ni/Fe-hydrogenase 1 B-type cytochrome subunit